MLETAPPPGGSVSPPTIGLHLVLGVLKYGVCSKGPSRPELRFLAFL